MNTIKVEILNPKAEKRLEDLVDLNLIVIQNSSRNGFASILEKLRTKAKTVPSIDEVI